MPGHAKCVRPSPAGAIRRVRLFERLDGASGAPLLWVEGPAGSGKTTLLATWSEARRLPTLWITLDAADAEPATFLHELTCAAADLAPEARLPRFGPDYALGVEAFFRSFFRALFDALPPAALLVLDDCHAIPAEAPLFALLREGLAEVPPKCRAALLSRRGPPPPLAALLARQAMAPMEPAALRLEPGEVEAIARRGGVTDPARVAALVAAVDGWAAGLVLLLAAHRTRAGPGPEVASPATFDYFASEVLAGLDGTSQRVLLEVALLPWVDAAQAESRLGIAGAAVVLERLARQACFTVPLEGAGARYRFHPLFHAFLRARAASALPAERLAALRLAGARLLEAAGEIAGAADLLREAGAWPELAALLGRAGPGLLDAGRASALAGWLALLPAETLAATPWLRYLRGLAAFGSDLTAAQGDLLAALDDFEAAGDASGAYLAWAALTDALVYSADWHRIDLSFERLARLRAALPLPDGGVAARVGGIALWAQVYRRHTDPGVLEWLGVALPPGDDRARVLTGAALVVYDVNCSGNLSRARVTIDEVDPEAERVDPAAAVIWQSAKAIYRYAIGDGEGCAAAANRGLEVAASSGARMWDFLLTAEVAWGLAAAGRPEMAAAPLARLAELHDPSRAILTAWLHAARGNAALARGDRRLCWAEFQIGTASAESTGCGALAALGLAGEATAAALLDLPVPERATLETALARAREAGSRFAEHHALVGLAARERQRGGPALEARLRELLATARETGYRCAVYLRPEELADLCAAAIDRGIEPATAAEMAAVARVAPPPWARHLAGWPWAVDLRLLGAPELLVAGRPLAAGPEASRALDLLCELALQGERGAEVDGLAAALWPEAEGDAAHHALETALYRLRRLLGEKALVLLQAGRLRLAAGRCRVDLWTLEERLTALERRLEGARRPVAAPQDDLEAVGRALLEAWAGPLLPGWDVPSAAGRRLRLVARLGRALEGAAAALAASGRGEAAAALREAAEERRSAQPSAR